MLPKPHFCHGILLSRLARQQRARLNHQGRAYLRTFHSTGRVELENHYATLGISSDATTAEIKKAFYGLSKTHHPDRNPNNQAEASKKFTAISNAYHVLSDQKERERYDAQIYTRSEASGSARSGFSAGARKASGLSRRKGAFRGPPPSYYRSANWSEAAPRRKAGGASDSNPFTNNSPQSGSFYGTGNFAGGTGSWPFNTDPNDVSHFDREGHYKTQTTVEEQLRKGRQSRRGSTPTARIFEDDDDGVATATNRFAQVCAILAFGVVVPLWVFGQVAG